MPDPVVLSLAVCAGTSAAISTGALLAPKRAPGAREWLRGRQPSSTGTLEGVVRVISGAEIYRTLRVALARRLELAGQDGRPEVVVGLALLGAAFGGAGAGVVFGTLADPGAGVIAAAAVTLAAVLLLVHRLAAMTGERRERLIGQLGPILELVSLELGGGAPPMLALENVLARSRSELAIAMREQLIGSRVAGSASFDGRLDALGDRLALPALHSMAMILGLSRDYGSGAGQGLRALAADLRRARRRRVIEVSRGALNRVLIPAAIGVLLPFMAILLFPAVSILLRSFS